MLAENGSRRSHRRARAGARARFAQVSHFSVGTPGNGNYGEALRQGILQARGRVRVLRRDRPVRHRFYARALAILESGEADLVIGSKLADGASDERPLTRHVGSIVINGMLRVALGFKGTDTHGLKAFRRDSPRRSPTLRRRQGPVRERVGDPRRARRRAHPRDPGARQGEARALDSPVPARPNVLKNLAKLVIAIRLNG